jgi:hypothetical protein
VLFEVPSPDPLTFLEEDRDDATASGWLIGCGPAQRLRLPLGDIAGWRAVYGAGKTAAGPGAGSASASPWLWLLGGVALGAVAVAVLAAEDEEPGLGFRPGFGYG